MSKIIVIDGNSLLFRAFYATYYDPSNIMRTKSGQATNAIFAFSNMITSLLSTLKKGDGIFVAFDAGKQTFRHKEFKEYKANRPPLPEDLITQFPLAREFLDKLNIIHYECDDLEADDICGVIANNAQKDGYKVYIYTSDKDYLQLIDENITIELIKKGLKDIKEMTPESFKEEWGFKPVQITDYKGLRGDDSDNLKGIPGVGDKTAKQLITQFGDLENIIKNADTKTKVGRNIIEFQENGRMCKHLAIIAKESEIPININQIIYEGYKFNSVTDFANKYEFKHLVSKLPKAFKIEEKHNEKVDFCEVFDTNDTDFTDEIGIDVDIENVNYHDALFNGLAFSINKKTYYINKENFLKDQKLLSVLKDEKIKKFAFDFKKVRYILKKNGIDINGLFFDLVLASYLLDSSIKSDIESVLNYYSIDISYATTKDLLFDDSSKQIAIATSYYVLALYEEIKEKLIARNQYDLLINIEQPLTIVLCEMELEGFPLDKETLLSFKTIYQEKLDILTKEIYELANEEFNINSPKQVSHILFEKLNLKSNKKGSTSVEFLEMIKHEHPIIEKILEYRKYAKIISTYVDGLIPFIHSDGKVHSTFNQALTTTGRLSSSEPNLQNISTRDEEGKQIRKAFFYKDDNLSILSLDYSQIELRMLAHLSDAKSMIEFFNNDEDVHAATAKRIFNLDREPTSQERRKAKTVNFGIVYGISDYGLSEQLDCSISEAKEIIKNFYQAFPEIKNYLNHLIDEATEKGYAETMFHRRRYLPELQSSQYQVREFAKRAAMNAPIQGSAADLMKVSMIRVYEAIKNKGFKSKIVSQIHDELIFKVYEDEKDEFFETVKDIMENSVKLKVKLKVDGGYARDWFSAK